MDMGERLRKVFCSIERICKAIQKPYDYIYSELDRQMTVITTAKSGLGMEMENWRQIDDGHYHGEEWVGYRHGELEIDR